MSVPAVWQHIRVLEKAYGTKLFEKTGRSIRPTAAATRLYPQFDAVLVKLESTFDIVGESTPTQIRLVTGVRMMIEDLAKPLQQFQAHHPVSLIVRHANSMCVEEQLLNDEVDIGLAVEPALKQTSARIHYEPAYAVEFLAVAKRNHPFMKSNTKSLRELAKHKLVMTCQGTYGRDTIDQALHREGLQADVAIETDNSATTISCVSAGIGVGVLAGRSNGDLCKKLATRSLSKTLGQCKIVLMWRKDRLLTESMLALVKQIKSIA